MPRDAFVLKIQRELCHPKYARKVSGLSRKPLSTVEDRLKSMQAWTKLRLCLHEFVFSFCALQRKCEMYWPTNEARSAVRGPLRITYLDEEAFAFYTVRRFEVKPVDQKSHYCQVLSRTLPTIFSKINNSTRNYCAETFMWMVTLEDFIHILKVSTTLWTA